MTSSVSRILWFYIISIVLSTAIAQRNSYLALWESAFDSLTNGDIERAADEIESSIPARGKIKEIIRGNNEQESVKDAEGSDEDNATSQRFEFGHLRDVVQQKREEFRRARSYRNLSSLVEETLGLLKVTDVGQKQVSLGALGNMTETLMDHAKHIKDLKDNDRADASKIASLAILQGWILRKLMSGQQKEFHATSEEESSGGQAPAPAPFGGAFGHGPHVKMSQLGVVVPETMDNMFSPSLCFRMQNFGNSDGFLSSWTAYGPECSARTAADTSTMKWRKESYYSIDCNLRDDTTEQVWLEENATDTAMSPIAAFGALGFENMAAKSMRALTKASHCIFAISSSDPSSNSHGTGSIMKITSISSRFSAVKANCIRVRLCNRNLDDYPAQSSQDMSGPIITLQSFTLNGRPLTLQTLTKVQAQTSDGSCSIMLLRVPSRALSDNFIMTGRLLTHDQQHIHDDQRMVKQYGVGEESSVDIQIGALTIL